MGGSGTGYVETLVGSEDHAARTVQAAEAAFPRDEDVDEFAFRQIKPNYISGHSGLTGTSTHIEATIRTDDHPEGMEGLLVIAGCVEIARRKRAGVLVTSKT